MKLAALALSLAALCACSPKPPEGPTPRIRPVSKECARDLKPEDAQTIKAHSSTDAGMHGLWDPQAFRAICTQEAWASQFIENADIEKNIAKGSFVPIYVHGDGGPTIELRVGSAAASAKYQEPAKSKITRRSDPFLFVSTGAVSVSGIEYIGGNPGSQAKTLRLPAGRWKVVILEVEPLPTASQEVADMLPNFVALINPEPSPRPVYNLSVETFNEDR